jgi:glucuronate isomerase
MAVDKKTEELIAERAAEAAVHRILIHLGIDATNPIQSQEDFQALRALAKLLKDVGLTEDLAFLRRLRTASDTIKDTTWKTAIRVVVTATLGILAIGTREWWMQHIFGLK